MGAGAERRLRNRGAQEPGPSPLQFRREGPRARRGRLSPKASGGSSRQDANPRSHPQASGPPPGPSVFPPASWALAAPPRLKQPRPSGQTPGSRRRAHSGGPTQRSAQLALHAVPHLDLASCWVPTVCVGAGTTDWRPPGAGKPPPPASGNIPPLTTKPLCAEAPGPCALAENPSHPPPLCPERQPRPPAVGGRNPAAGPQHLTRGSSRAARGPGPGLGRAILPGKVRFSQGCNPHPTLKIAARGHEAAARATGAGEGSTGAGRGGRPPHPRVPSRAGAPPGGRAPPPPTCRGAFDKVTICCSKKT